MYQDLRAVGPLLYLGEIDRQRDQSIVVVAKYQDPHGELRSLLSIDDIYSLRLRKPNLFRKMPKRTKCVKCQLYLYEWDLEDPLDTHQKLDTPY